jgi:D-alanine-D-alanine ligase
LLEALRVDRPEVVFNLFEGTARQGQTEAYLAGLLDWHEVAYTGCPFAALVLARDKPRAKLLLQGAGLPTPRFFAVDCLPVPPNPLGWPVIVKPAAEDASVGLDQGSVVTNQDQLLHRVARLWERFGPPILVEQFIKGREFNVSVIENPERRVLPIAEILFEGDGPGFWPIVTYDAKWRPESRDYLATPPHCPADLNPQLAEQVADLASQAFQLFGCRQYARVDFRLSAQGQPYILEVNPNPDFNPTAGLTQALLAAGLSHSRFTLDLVRQALQRVRW